jgi:hypothetical protein
MTHADERAKSGLVISVRPFQEMAAKKNYMRGKLHGSWSPVNKHPLARRHTTAVLT